MFNYNICILIVTFLMLSCKTSRNYDENPINDNKLITTTDCPDDGSCFFETIPNSTIYILTDDTGSIYPQFSDSDTTILKFEYKRDEQPNTVDGGYTELIYLEINKDQLEIELIDSELNQVTLLFGRLCYCKGSTGYYKITDGHLLITKKENDTYQIELSFKTTEVPQIINRISETFIIK